VVSSDCFACTKHRQGLGAPGGVLYEDRLVYAGHAFSERDSSRPAYRGLLVVEPKRHLAGLGDMDDEEAAAIGRLVNRLARTLKLLAGADHVYSWVMGHRVAHLHVLVAPRYPGTPPEYRGTRLSSWPDAPLVDPA